MAQFEFGCQIPAWHWHWDVSELRDWAQGVEAIGCDFISMADHVIYAYARDDRPQTGPYTDDVHQHEVMTTLAWLAALTNRVALQTNVLVLPQREPVLVAKQAAEIDILSGGRMRLGIGIGWQWQEFDALSANFRQRPSRMEEYIRVLRACWTEEPISFSGRYVNIDEMSVMPKPVTPGGPPILFGGFAQAAIERTARLGDGWIAPVQSNLDQLAELIDRLRAQLEANDRDPDDFPIQWLPPLDARHVEHAAPAQRRARHGHHPPRHRNAQLRPRTRHPRRPIPANHRNRLARSSGPKSRAVSQRLPAT